MPRRHRFDAIGRLHHALNRGQNGQRIFWYRRDYRFFLALLAIAVRAGRIRVHVYCLMPNHFHLLLESLDGNISATMQWIESRYAAYFNRTRQHSGHAFGGRFHSFPILSRVYLFILIRYIDRNPWKARMSVDPLGFCWGSAMHHAKPGPHPRWLARDIVDGFLDSRLADGMDRERAYRTVFGICSPDSAADALVEGRLAGQARGPDDLDALLGARPAEVEAWLWGRVRAMSGATVLLPMVDTGSIRHACAEACRSTPSFRLPTRRGSSRNAWPLIEVGLLRDLAGLTYAEAARLTSRSLACTHERYAHHRAAMLQDASYSRVAASVACLALDVAFEPDVRATARATGARLIQGRGAGS